MLERSRLRAAVPGAEATMKSKPNGAKAAMSLACLRERRELIRLLHERGERCAELRGILGTRVTQARETDPAGDRRAEEDLNVRVRR